MVIFGAHHTAKRFEDVEGTNESPGPGAYSWESSLTDAPAPRYFARLMEEGNLRPDGSPVLFTERDSWIRGIMGPKTPSARFVLEARQLSPSKRCLTPEHERAALGCESPGPGSYYPLLTAGGFPPPEHWIGVNKTLRTPRRGFVTKPSWGEPSSPARPPDSARSTTSLKTTGRALMVKKGALLSRTTSPRCAWVTGVSTPRGLQSWGDIAQETGLMKKGRGLDFSPRPQPPNPRRRSSARRGPVHSGEPRATSPDFREVRFLNHDLMKQSAGTANDTPGPGAYDVRPSMSSGITFAGPRPKSSRNVTVSTVIARAEWKATGDVVHTTTVANRYWPCLPPRPSNRLQSPLRGADSPGPAYSLPSDFDLKRPNKQYFSPPRCKPKSRTLTAEKSRKRGRLARSAGANDLSVLSRARDEMQRHFTEEAEGECGGDNALGLLVNTSMGKGILLQVRPNYVRLVQLPWGLLFTTEVLTH